MDKRSEKNPGVISISVRHVTVCGSDYGKAEVTPVFDADAGKSMTLFVSAEIDSFEMILPVRFSLTEGKHTLRFFYEPGGFDSQSIVFDIHSA